MCKVRNGFRQTDAQDNEVDGRPGQFALEWGGSGDWKVKGTDGEDGKLS